MVIYIETQTKYNKLTKATKIYKLNNSHPFLAPGLVISKEKKRLAIERTSNSSDGVNSYDHLKKITDN